ncbi:MAG TPA: polymer-forming cytoskeletal protein [Saprospiraceae bacterium]|nr:polymer-forming cytoskeletal protein [Saprospiraceae bacterium]
MFGANKKSEPTTNNSTGIGALNSLVQGTIVEGTVRAESDIRVDGIIKGDLNCTAKVIIGPTGEVIGEIRCANAMIEGKFEGVLHVEDLLNVRETAIVKGEIHTGKLVVQAGAVFNVTCDMGKQAKRNNAVKEPLSTENMMNPLKVG